MTAAVTNDLSQSKPCSTSAVPGEATFFLNVSCIVFLACLAYAAFGKCLDYFFLADDYSSIASIGRLFTHPSAGAFVHDLLSPWQDQKVQLFWRPISEVSLLIDYALHKTDAGGFHFTNLAIHASTSILLYLLGNQLLKAASIRNARATALAAAALFCVHPLHAEPVNWISGRVDLLCAMFSILSIYLFARKLNIASVVAFVLAVGSKESGIVVPVVLALYAIMPTAAPSATKKWVHLVPYAICAVGYISCRALVLHDLVGGYRGSIAQTYFALPWHYQFTAGTLWKVFYPINEELAFAEPLILLLRAIYLLAAAILVAKAVTAAKAAIPSVLPLILSWLALFAVPGWKFATIQSTLAGGRFAYLPLLPLSLLTAIVLVADAPQYGEPAKQRNSLGRLGMIVLASIMAIFIFEDRLESAAWLTASSQMRTLGMAVQAAVRAQPVADKIILLNVPTSFNGAHACYRDIMISDLLKPPLSATDCSGRVLSLHLNLNGDLLNRSLLARVCHQPVRTFVWDSKTMQLVDCPLPLDSHDHKEITSARLISATQEEIDGKPMNEYTLALEPAALSSRLCLLSLTFETSSLCRQHGPFYAEGSVRWQSRAKAFYKESRCAHFRVFCDGSLRSQLICLDHMKGWLLANKVGALVIDLPGGKVDAKLLGIQLLPGETLVPQLRPSITTDADLADGTVVLDKRFRRFDFDVHTISGAQGVLAELSKPQSYFQHYSNTLRDRSPSPFAASSFYVPGTTGNFCLNACCLGKPGDYQIRIFAEDKNNNILGYSSDPVEVMAK